MFPGRVVADGSLRNGPDYFVFDMRIPWYRALPLASIDILDLKVDGDPVDPSGLTFLVNDREYSLDALHERFDEWWFVTDPVGVRVSRDGGLSPGDHEVDLTLGMRIPYIVFGAGTHWVALQIQEHCAKTMTASRS